MNQKILDYSKSWSVLPIKMAKFYTQYENDEYLKSLPYFSSIEIFVLRLLKAKLYNERICIYSDYDTDAITSTASMYWSLLTLGFDRDLIKFYTPDRFLEGYGINPEAIKEISKNNDLIISVDCGVNSTIEATWLKENSKCELIITDHHQSLGQIPDCVCVVNPQFQPKLKSNSLEKEVYLKSKTDLENLVKTKLPTFVNLFNNVSPLEFEEDNGLDFASESLTGVGVSFFSTLWLGYFFRSLGLCNTNTISRLSLALPFVAIGTIADCQSVTEKTNRSLIRAGLKLLSNGQVFGKGLVELINQSYLKNNFDSKIPLVSSDIAFTLSPILNASGRIAHASLSISLLIYNNHKIPFEGQNALIENKNEAQLASELIEINNSRKNQVKQILKEINDLNFDNDNIIWIKGDWSKGLVGLVASRLVNEFNKPVAVFEEGEESFSASMRAPEGYDLSKIIKENFDLIIKGGGHKQAAGMTIKKENYQSLKEIFSQRLQLQKQSLVNVVTKEKQIFLDNEAELVEISRELQDYEPFGIDFPYPELVFDSILKDIRYFSEQKHARLIFDNIEVMLFNDAQKYNIDSLINKNIKLFVRPKIDVFRGEIKTTLITSKIETVD